MELSSFAWCLRTKSNTKEIFEIKEVINVPSQYHENLFVDFHKHAALDHLSYIKTHIFLLNIRLLRLCF